MNSNVDIFKKLIKFNVLLYLLMTIVYSYTESNDYNEYSGGGLFILIIVIIWFYNQYLLLKFKPLGKKIFLPLLILNIIYSISHFNPKDFVYENEFLYLIDFIHVFLQGVIVTFLYFTDIKKEFEEN